MSTPDAAARPAWWSPHTHLWACPGGCGPEIPIHECQPPLALLERTAELEAARSRLLEAIETEWYNGNLDTKARDRLLALAGEAEPA